MGPRCRAPENLTRCGIRLLPERGYPVWMKRHPLLTVLLALALAGCAVVPAASAQPKASTPSAPSVASTPATTSASPSASPTPTRSATDPSQQAQDPASLHLTAAGDYRDTSHTDAVLRGIGAAQPAANLILGDLSYGKPGKEGQWCSYVHDRIGDLPLLTVSGNHESDGRNGSIDKFLECLTPPPTEVHGELGKQYYVDLPAKDALARIIFISPGLNFGSGVWDYPEGSKRYLWTRTAIRTARDDGIPWVVVVMHEPCLTIGIYGCSSGTDIMNLLVQEKVDLVLHGHEHMYQRTKQIAAQRPGCQRVLPQSYNPSCVVAEHDYLTAGAGTVFVTVGTGGTPLRAPKLVDSELGYFAAWSGKNADATYGFLDLQFTSGRLSVSFMGVGPGQFTDAFIITRSR